MVKRCVVVYSDLLISLRAGHMGYLVSAKF